MLIVHDEHKGKNVGFDVTTGLREATKVDGKHNAIMLGVVDVNKDAANFWHKMGFKQVDEAESSQQKIFIFRYDL